MDEINLLVHSEFDIDDAEADRPQDLCNCSVETGAPYNINV